METRRQEGGSARRKRRKKGLSFSPGGGENNVDDSNSLSLCGERGNACALDKRRETERVGGKEKKSSWRKGKRGFILNQETRAGQSQ